MKEMNNNKPNSLTVPFVAICINDSNKPVEIPAEKWLKKGQQYTILKVVTSMDGQPGFVLKELTLGDDTYPFDCFSVKRFGVPMPEIKVEEEERKVWKKVEA